EPAPLPVGERLAERERQTREPEGQGQHDGGDAERDGGHLPDEAGQHAELVPQWVAADDQSVERDRAGRVRRDADRRRRQRDRRAGRRVDLHRARGGAPRPAAWAFVGRVASRRRPAITITTIWNATAAAATPTTISPYTMPPKKST